MRCSDDRCSGKGLHGNYLGCYFERLRKLGNDVYRGGL